MEKRVQTFYQQELEIVESLLSLANEPVIHNTCSNQVSASCSRENLSPLLQSTAEGLKRIGDHDCGIKTHIWTEVMVLVHVISILERSLTTKNLQWGWTCPFLLLNLFAVNLWVEK